MKKIYVLIIVTALSMIITGCTTSQKETVSEQSIKLEPIATMPAPNETTEQVTSLPEELYYKLP